MQSGAWWARSPGDSTACIRHAAPVAVARVALGRAEWLHPARLRSDGFNDRARAPGLHSVELGTRGPPVGNLPFALRPSRTRQLSPVSQPSG